MARFKARARAVDLLGRQQIASASTAITELFKNAHDAYADNVVADYFSGTRLLVIRDDGVGMTRSEFEERWLVIGTESKLGGAGGLPQISDPDKAPRPMLGEKGIGRLSIGLVGPQVLCLTRALRGADSSDLVAVFIDWRLFESRGTSLDEVEIPILECPGGSLPTADQVVAMAAEVADSARSLSEDGKLPPELEKEIRRDAESFLVDPQAIDEFFRDIDASPVSLARSGRGTHFFVKPTESSLGEDLASWEAVKDKAGREEPPELVRTLANFVNQMTPGHDKPPISTHFRHHMAGGEPREVPGEEFLFTEEEFCASDHTITGEFDAGGSFHGTITVFGEEHSDYLVPPPRGFSAPSACGVFEVRVAMIQGQKRESTLPDDDYDALNAKTTLFGGLYVYMDGIRVLPYGNTDFDWLNIELNRSKGAAFYYFSHRNMLGAVLLSRAVNSNLEQKAGREGFVKNGAYRDLRKLLSNLLRQLAADFFREGAPEAESYESGRKDNRARRQRAEDRKAANKKLRETLTGVISQLEAGDPHQVVTSNVRKYTTSVLEVVTGPPAPGMADRVLAMQREALDELAALRAKLEVSRGRFALGAELEELWAEYRSALQRFDEGALDAARREMARTTHEALEAAKEKQAWFKAVVAPVEEAIRAARTELGKVVSDLEVRARERLRMIRDELERQVATGQEALDHIAAMVKSFSGKIDSEAEGLAWQRRVLSQVNEAIDEVRGAADALTEQVVALTTDAASSPIRQLAAVEQRAVDLEDRLFEELQLVQLGMTVEVLSHELGNTSRGIREHLGTLARWGDRNARLAAVVNDLRGDFEHLDGYLTLFTPLQRRLRRVAVVFSGAEIEGYLRRLLGRELKDADVTLKATESFEATTVEGYPSVYYPVFVNLVLNAIYWLKDSPERTITLDANGGRLTVSDSGRGVPPHDAEKIFVQGWTRKPGGRGMGLPVSRDVMRSIGGDVVLVEKRQGSKAGATFAVVLPSEDE